MGKPSQTNATSTAINPVQVAQQPYLNYGWGQAQNLYQNNPQTYYPGQTLADYIPPNTLQTQGYQDLYNTGQNVTAGMWPTANTAFQQAASGQYGGQYNPAYGGYAQLAGGSGPVMQNYQALQNAATQGGSQYGQQIGQYAAPLMQYAQQAAMNNNLGLSQLGQTASGAYLNSNPYINAAIQAAQRPVTENFQTSVAPSMDAAASAAGRYGSGAMSGLYGQAQTKLAQGLGDISSNMMNANYARERQAQDAAAQNYGQLYNSGLGLGMQGMGAAAGIQNQAANQYFAGQSAAQQAANAYGGATQAGLAGLSSGFNTGNQAAMNALQMYPQLAQAAYSGPQATIQAGTGLTAQDQQYRQFQQQQIQDQMARYYGVQQAPWQGLEQFMHTIGSPQQGSSTQTTPYFSNPVAGIGSLLSGVGGLATAFSDRRLKEDDHVVGKIGDLPIHTFKYKGDNQQRIGFMADEVDPQAVVEHPSGYKMVNYERALGSALNSFMSKN